MMFDRMLRYVDINRDIRPGKPKGVTESTKLHWIPQWVALFLGILVQPSFQTFRELGYWKSTTWGWALFAMVTAIIVFPSVYRAAFDAKKPVIVLSAPIFTAGLGWEALLGTAVKIATGGP